MTPPTGTTDQALRAELLAPETAAVDRWGQETRTASSS